MAKAVTKKGIIPNLFLNVKRKRSKEARLEALKEGKSLAVLTVLKGAFDDKIQWNLPGGEPPDYNSNPLGKVTIEDVQPKLAQFVTGNRANAWRGNTPTQRAAVRERAWVDMLESMHEDEAEILIAMVDGNLNKLYNGVCYDLAKEAFPEIF